MKHRARVLLICLVAMLAAALALGQPAPAQQSESPPECPAQADTVPSDSLQIHGDIHGGLALALFTFAVAPSLLLPFLDPCSYADLPKLAFWQDHASVSTSVGGVSNEAGSGWTYSAGLELLVRGAYAEFRVEHYDLQEPVDLWSARTGYLIHPARSLAGGVTLGYRSARGAPAGWSIRGVEISFPIIFSCLEEGCTWWVRWEPTYVITPVRVGISPRFQVEFPLGRTPVLAGFTLEGKGTQDQDPVLAVALLRLRL